MQGSNVTMPARSIVSDAIWAKAKIDDQDPPTKSSPASSLALLTAKLGDLNKAIKDLSAGGEDEDAEQVTG